MLNEWIYLLHPLYPNISPLHGKQIPMFGACNYNFIVFCALNIQTSFQLNHTPILCCWKFMEIHGIPQKKHVCPCLSLDMPRSLWPSVVVMSISRTFTKIRGRMVILRRSQVSPWSPWYHLVMTSSLPWKIHPFLIGKPSRNGPFPVAMLVITRGLFQ